MVMALELRSLYARDTVVTFTTSSAPKLRVPTASSCQKQDVITIMNPRATDFSSACCGGHAIGALLATSVDVYSCHCRTIVDILINMLQPGLCSEDTLAAIHMQPHESFPL